MLIVGVQIKIEWFQPDILVCDAAKAIQNAFILQNASIEIFSADVIFRMGWADLNTTVQAQIRKIIVHKKLISDVISFKQRMIKEPLIQPLHYIWRNGKKK